MSGDVIDNVVQKMLRSVVNEEVSTVQDKGYCFSIWVNRTLLYFSNIDFPAPGTKVSVIFETGPARFGVCYQDLDDLITERTGASVLKVPAF